MFSGDLAFVHRPPTPAEVEKFRLLLSTFQDGSGMLAVKQGRTPNWIIRNHAVTLPGWRDFERTAALVLGGVGTENKFIYDVLLNDDLQPGKYIGISCKMRGELAKVTRLGRGSIELANAAGEFWAAVKRRTGLTEDTYSSDPALVGATLLSVVENWHMAVSASNSGNSS